MMACITRGVFIIAVLFCTCSPTTLAVRASENSLRCDTNFYLSWRVEDDAIHFKASAETTGYVGVGLSRNGKINGTDICIGGVKDNEPYFWDYYGRPDGKLARDDHLKCNLTSAKEINGTTSLEFERSLITEENVYVVNVTDSKVYLMCVYGDSDDVHVSNMAVGSKFINLLNYEHPSTQPTPSAPPTTTPSGCDGIYSLPVSCLRLFVFSLFAMFNIFV